MKKHLRFIVGVVLVPIVNARQKYTSKWIYVKVTIPELWYMVYRDMNLPEAKRYIEVGRFIKRQLH